MSCAANYGDVLDQLRAAGLMVESIEPGRIRRCKVDGDREQRGWYCLHEVTTDGGDLILIGSFGVWRGNDAGTQNVKLTGCKMSDDQRAAIKLRVAQDRKHAEAERRRAQENAARRAESAWRRYAVEGDSEYLALKGIQGYGVRYTATGSVVAPVMDIAGRVHGLQFLRSAKQAAQVKRPRKEFWPRGMAKKGHFHLIGMVTDVVFVAEGYATGASIHAATSGLPVAVAFDAGNLLPVATALRDRFRRARIVIVADDDCFTAGNPGVSAAQNTALAVSGSVFVPRWHNDAWRQQQHADGRGKLTDANDLAATDGIAALTAQLQTHLAGIGWFAGATRAAAAPTQGSGAGDSLEPLQDLGELLERFSLIYGKGGTVFDALEHQRVAISDMRDLCTRRELHRAWMEHPARKVVRDSQVGFDPSGDDPMVTCNTWGGWPTEPKSGCCERLLDLLQYLCSTERDPNALYQWILRWLAYPLQHPGAKMKSALVFHGLQGTGKNVFFETIQAIYGRYGAIIDQSAVEDRFNDWAGNKLFLIADEVVARSDVYHVKNKLKSFITGDKIRINPKNIAAYEERNHVNMVFLSNEDMPVALEADDRRHGVVWTPPPKPKEYYDAIGAELQDGGAAALHHYLLHLDLGEFSSASRPPLTQAKSDLIELGLDTTTRFFHALVDGDIPVQTWAPALSSDVYELYKLYCARIGYKPTSQPRLNNALSRRHGQPMARKRYIGAAGQNCQSRLFLFGQCPAETSEGMWIGDGVDAFRKVLEAYRGGV